MSKFIEIDKHLIDMDKIASIKFNPKNPVDCTLEILFSDGGKIKFKNDGWRDWHPLSRRLDIENGYKIIKNYLLNKE